MPGSRSFAVLFGVPAGSHRNSREPVLSNTRYFYLYNFAVGSYIFLPAPLPQWRIPVRDHKIHPFPGRFSAIRMDRLCCEERLPRPAAQHPIWGGALGWTENVFHKYQNVFCILSPPSACAFPHKVRTCFHFSEKEKACRCTSVCIQQTSACVVPASALSSSLYRPYSSVKAMGGLLATNAAACGHSFLFLKAKKLYHVTQIWEAPRGDVIIGKCRISSYSAMESWAHGRRPVCPVTSIFMCFTRLAFPAYTSAE